VRGPARTETGGHGSKFGRKKEAAIAALLTQRNVEEAARLAEGTQTPYGWMKEPEFQAAVSTLLKITVDPNVPASTRVRAADHVLEHPKDGIESEDILVRLTALEQANRTKPPGQTE
jgi:hypothetical protein